jgi:hypothetical protein
LVLRCIAIASWTYLPTEYSRKVSVLFSNAGDKFYGINIETFEVLGRVSKRVTSVSIRHPGNAVQNDTNSMRLSELHELDVVFSQQVAASL